VQLLLQYKGAARGKRPIFVIKSLGRPTTVLVLIKIILYKKFVAAAYFSNTDTDSLRASNEYSSLR
jgi:hypothetical protein